MREASTLCSTIRARSTRGAWMYLVAVVALGVSGCHHNTQVAYVAPPPPLPPAQTSHTHSTAHSTHAPAKPSADGPPADPATEVVNDDPLLDDTTGKPISVQYGLATWYGPQYNHHHAADGSVYEQNGLTAAHLTLPLGSTVRVTNVATKQSVLVRITDRGPFGAGRVIDLSMGAAKAIGVYRAGVAKVKIEAWPHASADPAGKWCVQIGAFKDPNDALDVKAALLSKYHNARVIEFAGPTGHWVRINPSKPDLAHANEVAKSLELPDPNAVPYVVRLD